METQQLAQAQEALHAIGAQKALPTLLSLVKTKDSPARAWVLAKAERYHIRFLHLRSATECQLQGIAGFEVLGTNCAPAVQELTRLLADQELAFVAVRCLGNIGNPAEAALCQCLTNKDPIFNLDDPEVSMGAARALIALDDDAQPALPALAALIDTGDRNLALGAMISALGTGTSAIPCLLKGFTNQFADVRGEAAHFITEWGAQFPEQRQQAIPYLIRLLSDPDENVRRTATNSLVEIDPQAAARLGSNPQRRP